MSLTNTNVKVYSYGAKEPLPLLGQLITSVSTCGNERTEATFQVVKGSSGCLLSYIKFGLAMPRKNPVSKSGKKRSDSETKGEGENLSSKEYDAAL